MSLREAYTLAHTAQCRLQMEASRPDRKLRFVVGHLMHYESMRLRIVEIEHDISSRGSSRRSSFIEEEQQAAPRISSIYDDLEEDDEDDDEGLELVRFPSGSSRLPDMISDEEEEDEEEDEEPVSPDEDLQECMRGDGDEDLRGMYEAVRRCSCREEREAPVFDRVWEVASQREGVTRAVARVKEEREDARKGCTETVVEVQAEAEAT